MCMCVFVLVSVEVRGRRQVSSSFSARHLSLVRQSPSPNLGGHQGSISNGSNEL